MPKSILFVCLGNICRSPLAEALAKQFANKQGLDLVIDSCGTGSWHVGEAPCSDSIRVAKEHGLDISHQRARQINQEDLLYFDLIIVLDEKNLHDLKMMGAQNVHKLGAYGYNNEDVPDPYFFPGYEGFDKVYNMIDTCVTNLMTDIR
ncbi:MAG: low molecular weight phosphotyrosine protein phosphatase [Helicobacteraceae bacterium]|nr:low molecular weight phosphotyrosine protein phosphatase [Helicobacteraceae bacterium]